jgi:hypothetical protein
MIAHPAHWTTGHTSIWIGLALVVLVALFTFVYVSRQGNREYDEHDFDEYR